MSFLETLGWFYLAMVATVFVHELGHHGRRIKITRWFPWVEGASFDAKYQYGGLIVNFIMTTLIYVINPTNTFLQLFGLLNWLHFSIYAIFGSFNKEYEIPDALSKYFVFDDVPNRLWYYWVPLGIINFILFKAYYLPIIYNLFSSVVG